MGLYIVKHGEIKVGEGDVRRVGDVVELEDDDKIVTLEHEKFFNDKEGQPQHYDPPSLYKLVEAAPPGTKPHKLDENRKAETAMKERNEAIAQGKIPADIPAAPAPKPVQAAQPTTKPEGHAR